MVNLFRRAACWLLAAALTCPALTVMAQDLDVGIDTSLPITLDADSSEFDRRNNRLTFQGLRIMQGALGVTADEAEATRLDFEDSLWVFRGNVVIDSDGTVVYCDRAEMIFRDHELRKATLEGMPARFEQRRAGTGELTRGRARLMEYDLGDGIIRMMEDAWLSDGANEVSGARISYDLAKEYIIADADDEGPIRMKINPPERDGIQETP